MQTRNTKHVTILLQGGLLSPDKMQAINQLAQQYDLTYYCSTAQNLRLLGATEENIDEIKKALTALDLQVKAPGMFPLPKVCVGKPFCNLGLTDTFALSDKITARYGSRADVKPKFKIAVAGCPASCSGALLADIGIISTRIGYDLYVGGKGGPLPRVGVRVARGLSEEEVVDAVGRIADFHAANTPKKQRMFKLLDKPDFPFPLKN
ncbi:MAG: nitrite reductase [Desulfobulbaceae bacterium]|nr:nitrite reductase [Desulfobulbaceae bacterium]